MTDPTALAHFDELHSEHADPWDVDRRWYERRRRQVALALLPREVMGRTFEPGCSIGALTEQLAPRSSTLLAWDASRPAVELARRRVERFPHVQVEQGAIPVAWPEGTFDLVVLSELGYYLSEVELGQALDATARSLGEGGTFLAVHWRHVADDFRLPGGDAVHAAIHAHGAFARTAGYADADVRAETFTVGG